MTDSGQPRAHVLVVDDEPGICRALSRYLAAEGHRVHSVSSGEEALTFVRSERLDVALVDLRLPGMDGMTVLERMRAIRPEMEIVLITAFGGADTAIRAIQQGAYSYVPKPLDLEEIGRLVRRTIARRPIVVHASAAPEGEPWELVLQGPSAEVRQLRDTISDCARRADPVLFAGEVGSGREAAARALHRQLGADVGSFRLEHCSAFRAGRIDSILSEIGGTATAFWFLAELGEPDPSLTETVVQRFADLPGQPRITASLLRSEPAANRTLEAARHAGWSIVEIPPLRARREDLPRLVSLLLARNNAALGRGVKGVDESALGLLQSHVWPGNLAELANVVRLAVLAARDEVLLADSLALPSLSAPTRRTSFESDPRGGRPEWRVK
jgi:two-component system response regulator HydG